MGKRILIVDDDPGNVKLIEHHLQKQGFDTFSAFDGKEGLNAVLMFHPDLIILDVEMPRMNGYTFMLQLKDMATYSSTPVIVLTAHADHQTIFELRKVKHYLVKPVKLPELLSKINECLFKEAAHFTQKVLIVENNPTQAKLIAHFLDKAGFKNLLSIGTGIAGIEKTKLEKPDVVVINANLPDWNGYKVCKMIKEVEHIEPKVILLAAKSDEIDEQRMKEHGVDGYALKSERFEELIERLKESLGL